MIRFHSLLTIVLYMVDFHYAFQIPSSPKIITSLFQTEGVLSPEYYKNVYNSGNGSITNSSTPATPWDIGGGKPQPAIVKAYDDGKLRGRILDAGCGTGENCIYLAGKYGVTSVVGFDLSEGAIDNAKERVLSMESDKEKKKLSLYWTSPTFLVASCTEISDILLSFGNERMFEDGRNENVGDSYLFDVAIDSGLLHCLSDEDARMYVDQLKKLLEPDSGRVYVGCFSSANPDPWDNPRRLSPAYLRNLFCEKNGWEVVSIDDTWWSRPPQRGSSQGSFSMALWMEARRIIN